MRVLMAAAAMALAALAFGVQAVSAAPPVFPNSSYSKTVAENAAVNSEVITVKSSTEGAEHALTGTGAEDFKLDKDTGVITVQRPLDYEKMESYSLTVTASASGESTAVPLTITVTDVGPAFPNSSYSFTVAENAAVNSEVITVKSSTEGAEHELSGTGNDDFEIVKTTGVITVNKTLDYEKKNSYDLMVTARASGESTDVPLTITVPNVGPAFGKASYGFTVAEDKDKPYEVGTVTASPAGAEYTLSGVNAGDFTLNKDTGVITVQVTLDHEDTSSYSLTVTATDSAKETTSVPVTITVTDVGPSFGKASYGFTVAEDAAANAEVGTVRPARRARSTR